MEGIDTELEDEILLRVANRTERNLGVEADGQAETQHDPSLLAAMRLTSGYVSHLRLNTIELLKAVQMSDEAKQKCIHLGKFVAYMRARPSTLQEETAEREFAPRLVSQHIRLAKCLAAVLNKKEVDSSVLQRVRRISMDTSRGQTLEILKQCRNSKAGITVRMIAISHGMKESKATELFHFLKKIGVLTPIRAGTTTRWNLTSGISKLYTQVTN
jgi:hypothetical protein